MMVAYSTGPPMPLSSWTTGHCDIQSVEDIRDLFVEPFHFGCEADDPLNAPRLPDGAQPFSTPAQDRLRV